MSTTTTAGRAALSVRPVPSLRRSLAVLRLQFVDRWSWLWIPLIILAGSFGLTVAVWLVLVRTTDGQVTSENAAFIGSTQAVFWYLVAMAIQSVSRMFPLALGLSATRRQFTTGTAAFLIIMATALGAVYALLTEIEIATGGWGIDLPMFRSAGLSDFTGPERIFVVAASALLLMSIGTVFAAIYLRWKTLGVVLYSFAFAIVLIGVAAAITINDWWSTVAAFLFAGGLVGASA